jgi:hypothetical protein
MWWLQGIIEVQGLDKIGPDRKERGGDGARGEEKSLGAIVRGAPEKQVPPLGWSDNPICRR